MAVCFSRSYCISFDFELHTVLGINQPLHGAVHGCVIHGAQVNPEGILVVCEILDKIHVGPAARMWVEVPREFPPHVCAIDTFVVDPVGYPVDRDLHFCNVWVDVPLRFPGSRCVGGDEQDEDPLE